MSSLSIICDNDDEAEEETAQGIQAAMGDRSEELRMTSEE